MRSRSLSNIPRDREIAGTSLDAIQLRGARPARWPSSHGLARTDALTPTVTKTWTYTHTSRPTSPAHSLARSVETVVRPRSRRPDGAQHTPLTPGGCGPSQEGIPPLKHQARPCGGLVTQAPPGRPNVTPPNTKHCNTPFLRTLMKSSCSAALMRKTLSHTNFSFATLSDPGSRFFDRLCGVSQPVSQSVSQSSQSERARMRGAVKRTRQRALALGSAQKLPAAPSSSQQLPAAVNSSR
eukprot:1189362-Prorocentrum_minimum.AAC.1